MPLLTRKRLLQAKIESTYGTDSSPVGTDCVLVRSLDVTPLEADVVSRDLLRSFMGNYDNLLSQTRVSLSFEVELSGSGTAGTAPRYDALLRACGMSATTTGAAVTGAAVAGAANTITLAVGASAVDDFYNGMIISITSGTGSGHSGLITDYVGSTKVATVQAITATFVPAASSGYSIAANVAYKPVSTAFESATIYCNVDGVLHKVTGCRGSFSLSGSVGEIPTISFTFTGIYNAPTDTAQPTVTYSNQATPVVFKPDFTKAFSFYGYSSCLMSLSIDMAVETVYRELVGCTKQVLITDRKPSGNVSLEAPTVAAKDYFLAAVNDTVGLLSLVQGTTSGNQVGILASRVDLANPTYSDSDGVVMLDMPFAVMPSASGNDELNLTFQ